jgi:FGGY-family pentulose kinase
MTADGDLFLGIDVGTGSARVGIFGPDGTLLATAACPIRTATPRTHFAQQSTAEIWRAICAACAEAMVSANVPPARICGIGVDATCSLAVIGEGDASVSVCPDGTPDNDVILWSDHRAMRQAAAIEKTGNAALRSVGGRMSPEMQLPKLLWLQQNLPDRMAKARHFFDLPDWIVYRATGHTTRSLCSATCKWTYRGQNGLDGTGWDHAFLSEIGLGGLTAENCRMIGNVFAPPGSPVGSGLSETAAADLGLIVNTPVAASLIDAYAGALGTIGVGNPTATGSLGRMALIAGTSACHVTLSPAAMFVPGVWGPYLGVLFPDSWANEAGQSACGALIDRIVTTHPAAPGVAARAKEAGRSIHAELDRILADMVGSADQTHSLTADLHIQPDFPGNRAPLADPTRRGAISGLTMAASEEDLARLYLATIQSLAYGTRQIIAALRADGVTVDEIVVSGGLARSPLYLREHADATGCAVLVPEQAEPVLLGSAMLGAVAAGHCGSLEAAALSMAGNAARFEPRGGAVGRYHDAKYDVFLMMQSDFAAYAAAMARTKGS